MASKRWAVDSALLLLLVALSGFLGGAAARTIKHDHSRRRHHQQSHICQGCMIYEVGDKDGWTDNGVYYGLWSWTKDFYEGDAVVFNYDNKVHKVMEVTLKDYRDCNTSNPIKVYDSGHDSFIINNEISHRYFISGDRRSCLAGQKVNIRVAQKEEEEETYPEQSFSISNTRHRSPTSSPPPIPPSSTPWSWSSLHAIPPSAAASSASPNSSSFGVDGSGKRILVLASVAAIIVLSFFAS